MPTATPVCLASSPIFSSCCSRDSVSNFVIAVLGKLEPYHYSGSLFHFFVLVIVTRFFMIKYSILSIIVVGKKAAVSQFLVTAAFGYSIVYPRAKNP